MPDLSVNDLIDAADRLPAACVALEVSLKNVLVPIVAAVAATKNPEWCKDTDRISLAIFDFEVKVNGWAQRFADTVDMYKPFAILVGGFTIPGSGILLEEVSKVLGSAQKFQSSIEAHNTHSIATAKNYLTEFVGAAKQVVTFRSDIGNFEVAGMTVTQLLGGLERVASYI